MKLFYFSDDNLQGVPKVMIIYEIRITPLFIEA
jgi:hypothetical protein